MRLYKPGYAPSTSATFEGLRLYRNSATGIFVHRSSNILITNSHFADNNIGIDLDRTDGIEVRNTVVIGESDSYRGLMSRQVVERVCRNSQDRWLVGIDLHTWKTGKENAGATLSNLTLSGFMNVQCPNSASIRYDSQVSDFHDEIRQSTFFTNITIHFADTQTRAFRILHFIQKYEKL